MKLPKVSPEVAKANFIAVVKWVVVGGLLVSLIMSVVQCSIARNEARLATVQTYNMSRVAEFRDSGKSLDKSIAAFNDAAAEGRDLTDARKDFRSALAEHAAQTMAMRDAFGETSMAAYQVNLKELQQSVEDAKDATTSGRIITAMSRVVVERNKLSEVVVAKATG